MDEAKFLELVEEALEGFNERLLKLVEGMFDELADEGVPKEPAEA